MALVLEDVAPAWVARIRWLWQQDECVHDAERLEAAWLRIFGAALPPQHTGTPARHTTPPPTAGG